MEARLLVLLALATVSASAPLRAAPFEEIVPGALPASIGVAWGDYDGDGYTDLFLPGYNRPPYPARPPQLYRNNGDLTFTEVGQSLGLPSAAVDQEGAAWADYNNDGRLDLLVTCRSGPPSLFRRDETGFIDVAAAAGVAGSSASAGASWYDFNGDGNPDAMVLGGYAYLYHNNDGETFVDLFK
jgi:hypothetical protein